MGKISYYLLNSIFILWLLNIFSHDSIDWSSLNNWEQNKKIICNLLEVYLDIKRIILDF